MPVSTLRPSSIVTSNSWAVFSGAILANVSDASDGTSIYNTNANDEFDLGFENLSAQASSINSVQASMRYSRSSSVLSATIQQFVRLGGNTTYDSVQTSPDNAIYARSFNPARPGGGSYFPSDINSMTGGAVSASGDPSEEVYCYDIWWSIDWSSNSGFFIYLVLGALGELSNVAFHELPRLVRAVYEKTDIKIKPTEFQLLFAELRTPRPKYQFL